MSSICNRACFAGHAARQQVRSRMKPMIGLLVLALLMALGPARAEGPDDDYLDIFNLIQQADDLDTGGKAAPAKVKYQQALTALVAFQKARPDWNAKLVSARRNYLTEKLAALSEKAPAPAGAATNGSAAGAVAAATSTQVKLLEPGAEPRKALRFHPAPDDKQTLTMTLKLAQGDLKLTVDSTVKQVGDNGSITYVSLLRDVEIAEKAASAPEAVQALKGMLSVLKGLSSTGTVSSQGLAGKIKVQGSTGSNPIGSQFSTQIQEMLGELVVPFPKEDVGVGAKWEVKGPVTSQGFTVDQTATYELVSLEGERLTVKDSAIRSATNQKIQNPAMPGMRIDVAKMAGKASGQRTVDLTHLLPISGSGRTHGETVMTMNMGGQKQPMNSKYNVEIQFEAK